MQKQYNNTLERYYIEWKKCDLIFRKQNVSQIRTCQCHATHLSLRILVTRCSCELIVITLKRNFLFVIILMRMIYIYICCILDKYRSTSIISSMVINEMRYTINHNKSVLGDKMIHECNVSLKTTFY